jgi:hypothetical protein
MNLAEKLYNMPVCRWEMIKSDYGTISVYRCDTEDMSRFIIEGPGPIITKR